MDHEKNSDLIELGSVTAETKGLPGDDELDIGPVKRPFANGLSDD